MNCNWNKATKKDIDPKMIPDILIRKKLGSNIVKNRNNRNVNSGELRPDDVQSLNSVLLAFLYISDESVSKLYNELYKITPESVIFKCIPMDGEEEKNPLFSLNVVAEKIIQNV